MKREIHEAEVRKNIIRSARRLFLQQGYHNTKVREIKDAAEVKIGTLYHFYQNKEDIFSVIVLEAFFRVLERIKKLTQGNTLLDIATEIAWHVYTMALLPRTAELYLVSYNSPKIAAQLLSNQTERSIALFGEHSPQLTADDHQMYAMLAKGLMQSISIQATTEGLTNPAMIINKSVGMLLKVMNTPLAVIDETLRELDELEVSERVKVAIHKDHEMT